MNSKAVRQAESQIAAANAKLEALRAAHLRDLRESHEHLAQQHAEIQAAIESVRVLTAQAQSAGLTDMGFLKPIARPLGGRPTRSRHPFPRAVGNVRAWAKAAGLPWSTVKKWYSTGSTLAAIPRFWQQHLEHTYGIPATAWRGGIRD